MRKKTPGEEKEECDPTIFDTLNPDCLHEILDWLALNSLCALAKTCKSLRKTTREYFQLKYRSVEFTVGDEFVFNAEHVECFGDIVPELCLYDSSIDEFAFAGSHINRNVREISFEQTFKGENQITKTHIDAIEPILQNVKTVGAFECDLQQGCPEYLLEKCQNLHDFAFKVHKNLRNINLQFKNYSKLRNILVHFDGKTNVIKAIEILKEQHLQLDELVLSFQKEHSISMGKILDELESMQAVAFFKRLYLSFDTKATVTEHIDRLASMAGLEGVLFGYTINSTIDTHIADVAKLQQLKYLNINLLLGNADEIAEKLQELIEVEFSTASIDAIASFVRYSSKLMKLHVDKIRENKVVDVFVFNELRSKLQYARKLDIYIPEKIFIKLKWSSVPMKSDLVEIKREESCIPKAETEIDQQNVLK